MSGRPREANAPLFKATAAATINGVGTELEILAEDDGETLFGIVGVSQFPGKAFVAFELKHDRLEFTDLPVAKKDERAVRKTFGIPGVELRGCLCKLATEALLGPEVRALLPEEVARLAQQRAGATVH